MMKVVHITTVHPPFDQRIFFRECISLHLAGFEVTLLAQNQEDDSFVEGVHVLSIGNVKRSEATLRPLSRIRNIFKSLKLSLSLKADIYHIHDPELLIIIPVLKLFSKARVIYDSHEDNAAYILHKHYIPIYLRKGLSILFKYYELLFSYFADAVIAADPGIEKNFKAVRVKTQTIYNFPRLDFFSPSLSQPVDIQYDLVYHGSIPRYHLEGCLSIDKALMKRGRQVRWLFFCRIAEMPWIDELMNNNPASDRFVFKNHVPHNTIAYEVRKARIGIIPLPDLPKFQINIPSKLFEFMALEMPVILSDLPPSRPFTHDSAIMVPPTDYDAYADAIIKLLDDSNLRHRMGRAGRLNVESKYNWDSEAEKLVNLYYSLTTNLLPGRS